MSVAAAASMTEQGLGWTSGRGRGRGVRFGSSVRGRWFAVEGAGLRADALTVLDPRSSPPDPGSLPFLPNATCARSCSRSPTRTWTRFLDGSHRSAKLAQPC